MNVLIVDDNKDNRMILSLLLADYMDENRDLNFSIDEAVDGLEAVQMCESKKYSIIFIDIMMPNMDGIEATKLIRRSDTKVMIIAVSVVDDLERQKEILACGAEDYISKPVKAYTFKSRVSHYLRLINSRNNKEIKNEEGVNLFTKEIYNRYTNFKLSSEDALSELWECFLLEGAGNYEGLSDVIRMIFSLGEVQLSLGVKSNLIVENSYEYQYFTVNNIDAIPPQVLTLLIKKNEVTTEYKIKDNKLSFKLEKIEEVLDVKELNVEPIVHQTLVVEKKAEVIVSSVDFKSEELQIFDYIDPDDMADLEEYTGKLNALMFVVGSGDVSEEEAMEIYSYIERLGSILASYSEIYVIANSLKTLANDMAKNIDVFIQNSESLGPMCAAFSNDLSNWVEQSFHTGAPSVGFMNDTIAVNCQTIGSMLKMDEAEGEDLDDIFDF